MLGLSFSQFFRPQVFPEDFTHIGFGEFSAKLDFGISHGAVRVRAHRAYGALRKMLREEGFDLE